MSASASSSSAAAAAASSPIVIDGEDVLDSSLDACARRLGCMTHILSNGTVARLQRLETESTWVIRCTVTDGESVWQSDLDETAWTRHRRDVGGQRILWPRLFSMVCEAFAREGGVVVSDDGEESTPSCMITFVYRMSTSPPVDLEGSFRLTKSGTAFSATQFRQLMTQHRRFTLSQQAKVDAAQIKVNRELANARSQIAILQGQLTESRAVAAAANAARASFMSSQASTDTASSAGSHVSTGDYLSRMADDSQREAAKRDAALRQQRLKRKNMSILNPNMRRKPVATGGIKIL